MALVTIVSEYQGKSENYDRLKTYMRRVAEIGHTPLASVYSCHEFMNDHDPQDRRKGVALGIKFIEIADEVWAFLRVRPTDDADMIMHSITGGVYVDLKIAAILGKPISIGFCIDDNPMEWKDASPALVQTIIKRL